MHYSMAYKSNLCTVRHLKYLSVYLFLLLLFPFASIPTIIYLIHSKFTIITSRYDSSFIRSNISRFLHTFPHPPSNPLLSIRCVLPKNHWMRWQLKNTITTGELAHVKTIDICVRYICVVRLAAQQCVCLLCELLSAMLHLISVFQFDTQHVSRMLASAQHSTNSQPSSFMKSAAHNSNHISL